MRIKATFSKEEMHTIINALDFYSRIWIGQYDRILSDIRWYRNCKDLDNIEYTAKYYLMDIRHMLLPELDNIGWNGSYGIFSDEINFKAGVAYNMQQVFRYTLAYFENPKGGWSVDYNKPIKAELDPYRFPKAKCEKIDGQTYITIDIGLKQFEIIKNALIINAAMLNGEVTKIFEFYTKRKKVFKLTQKIDKLLEDVKIERKPQSYENIIAKIDKYAKG